MDTMEEGQRVEVLLSRGEAEVYYRGTVLAGGRVLLDDGYPYGEPPGNLIVEAAGITNWRPLLDAKAPFPRG